MTAFEKFKARQREKIIQHFPASVPTVLRSLTRAEFMEALKMSDWAATVPEAELTPEIVALGRMQKEATQKSYEAFIGMGKILLELKRRFPVETEFWEQVDQMTDRSREDSELAMEAAAEAS